MISGNLYEKYKCNANDVIFFRLVASKEDLQDDSKFFKPDMTHQLFGASESIFGYQDLKVDINCSAASMKPYINLHFSEKLTEKNIQPDNILHRLSEKFQSGFFINEVDFIKYLDKESNFRPYGKLVHSFTVKQDLSSRHFSIYKVDIDEPEFRDYHERLQPFLLFYVDAASYIDVDDPRWSFYIIHEKLENNFCAWAFAGYMTVYHYYAYIEKLRPRISQVLILPSYQKLGLCTTLLKTFYMEMRLNDKVLDITVEDPSETFQRVRDFVDAQLCLDYPEFKRENLLLGFSKDMALVACEKLKINKRQARRVYEILRLSVTNQNDDEELRNYRLEVKKRLNIPFQKKSKDMEKLSRILTSNELSATFNNFSMEQRWESLDKIYQECLTEYEPVVHRLKQQL